MLKKSVSQYINEVVNERLQNAIKTGNSEDLKTEVVEELEEAAPSDGIVTTEEELQSFYITKSILGGAVPLDRISYKDTASYFGIVLDNKVTKWICRVFFKRERNVCYHTIKWSEYKIYDRQCRGYIQTFSRIDR